MKKLLFIGHVFHQKTGSSSFMVRLLEQDYLVTTCYIDVYSDQAWSVLSVYQDEFFDVLVCWQVMPPIGKLLQYIATKHKVLFPMADDCPKVSRIERWYPFRDFQIICFSTSLAVNLKSAGFSAYGIQYFPEPIPSSDWGNPNAVFFWNRRNEININTVDSLLQNSSIDRVHLHKSLDPGCTFIPLQVESKRCFSYSTWYDRKEDMLSDIRSCAYYVAPRVKEGIGMSFLEAMAMGRCVIAPDSATMNEYITHEETGYLYDLDNPEPLNFVDVRALQKRAYRFMCAGYEQWCKDRSLILKWMIEPVCVCGFRLWFRMTVRFMRSPIKFIKALRVKNGA